MQVALFIKDSRGLKVPGINTILIDIGRMRSLSSHSSFLFRPSRNTILQKFIILVNDLMFM